MKLVFITLYDKGCLGIRYISSVLKEAGHHVSIVYLGNHEGKIKTGSDKFSDDENLWISVNEYGADLIRSYSDSIGVKDQDILMDLLKKSNPDIIGFSLRTMFLDTAIKITGRIRKAVNAPIIFGGIAATSEPEKCIQFADMVCLGEGERAMLELANSFDKGGPLHGINNIWFRDNDAIHKNALLPLEQSLDNIPFPDYAPENKFSILGGKITENDTSIGNMSEFTYEVITSRGCPFACSYCCNDLLKRLYAGQKFLRRRSVKNVIQELVQAKESLHVKTILFKDEIFTYDFGWLKEFSKLYKENVNLPFWCYTHPLFAEEKSLQLLKDCGMFNISMGIQSGSENVLYNIFNRPTPYAKIVESAHLLERLKLPIRPRFDIITNNPFEAEEDRRKTFELLMDLPKPLNFGLTKLSFIPGSKMTSMLPPENRRANERLYSFWNALYLLNQYKFFPKPLMKYLSKINFFKERPYFLRILLLPKFFEIKFGNLIERIKNNLPKSVILSLKRLRLAFKGY